MGGVYTHIHTYTHSCPVDADLYIFTASRVIREGFRVLQILGTLSVFNPIQIKAFQGRGVSPDLLRFSEVNREDCLDTDPVGSRSDS